MMRKRLLSVLCLLTMTLGLLTLPAAAEEPVTMMAGGWFETICAQLTGVTDADVAEVSYTDAAGVKTTLTGEDFQYLVRDMDGGVRIDIPGVKAGSYRLDVQLKSGEVYRAGDIAVSAYDRSGFAHKVHTRDSAGQITGIQNYTAGVGAYNDDGTLKDNAVVLYVTEETKDTVTLTQDFTVTGIGNILNCKGWDRDHSGTAQRKLLLKMGDANRPIVVRIIGEVTKPEGVTAAWSEDKGGAKDDAGGMCMMEYVGNITVEGIGPDATVNGWGFSFSADGTGRTAEKNNKRANCGQNIEVRNLTFRNVPEDCVNIMGAQDTKDGFKDSAEHSWVHNNSFYGPKGLPDKSKDQDKSEGDGAVDFRNGEYMTLSYNYFDGYHKTSLIGGADGNLQYHVTWHHNWWKNVYSRSPLCRQADVHIYNNLYDGQTSYCMSLRANCYIFSEYNTFRGCKNPVVDEGTKGVCKSYGDVFTSCNAQKPNAAKIVTDKSETVTGTCLYANFDTDAKLSYIPAGSYALQTDAAEAEATVRQWSGVQKQALTVEGHKILSGELDTLAWSYDVDNGYVTVDGQIGEDELVLVAVYKDDRMVGVKVLTAGEAAKMRTDATRGKLFWLTGERSPRCAASGWGETQ